MDPKFSVVFLSEVAEFLDGLDDKSRRKVIYNIDKSRYVNDPKLFKKLTKDIWEFRAKYQKNQYRLDPRDNQEEWESPEIRYREGGKDNGGLLRRWQLKILKVLRMRSYTLNDVKDKYIGKEGSPEREAYELDLKIELIGEAIKKIRKKRSMTQSELGELIGVKKAQISKLENNTTNVSIGTLMRVFKALETKVKLHIETEGAEMEME